MSPWFWLCGVVLSSSESGPLRWDDRDPYSVTVSGYGQFCPVAQALDLVGERWTLLVVREILCGSHRFTEILRGVPLMPKSLLSLRLKTLEEAGLVQRCSRTAGTGFEYHLTEAGRELEPIVFGLGTWGKRWVRHKLTRENLDPNLLMWDVRRRLDPQKLPERSTLVMFWFRDLPAKSSRYWLHVQRPEVELCLTNPGFVIDLEVETTLRTLVAVWMGERACDEALRSGSIELKGPRELARDFPNWLRLSTFASEASVAASCSDP